MESSTTITRALTALGKKTEYSSPGHMPSFAASSFPQAGKLDCSGFVYWCMRYASTPPENRTVNHPLYKKINGGWFETSAIHADGLADTGFFRQVEPALGAFLVYPDYRGADGKIHDGHIGIVTGIDETKSGIARVTKIIHCSSSGWKNKGDAVQETPPTAWLAHDSSIAVWYEGFNDDPQRPDIAPGVDATETGAASAAGAKEAGSKAPVFRSLIAGGFFSDAPFDLTVPRSIRTNNPGALNVTGWQRNFAGFVGVTAPDRSGNVTSIYVTPEHGIAAWHYLMTDRYKFGETGQITLPQLAKRYSGVPDEADKRVKFYVSGWTKWAPGLKAVDNLALASDKDMLLLALGMFGHEAGRASPLHDDQIVGALGLKRSGKLPKI